MSDLRQPLTLTRGTAVMLNIVIGAGLLALPGLAVKQAGSLAYFSWILCALVALPLLSVFVILGKKYPNAGGIAHFSQMAFGRRGYASASLLFLGAIIFGLPSIALTGGHYAALLIGGSPHLIGIALLCAATLIHFLSSTLVARANAALAAATLVIILVLIVVGFWNQGSALQAEPVFVLPALSDWSLIIAPFMMIFFAFTGWEVAAGLSEEFKNPQRDFPRAMIGSFVVVVSIYLLIAYLVQHTALSGDYEVAFARIAESAIGPFGLRATAIVATLIIFANLSGAIWAVSRMVYSLSREGFLPAILQTSHHGTPWLAVGCTAIALILTLSLDWVGFLSIDRMLSLAGQNFTVLYGIAAAALLFLTKAYNERILCVIVVAIVLGLVALQGMIAFYPALLLIFGYVTGGKNGLKRGILLRQTAS